MADDIFLTSSGIGSRRGVPVNFQMPPATISDGAANGGIFRGHTIQFPWTYTQTSDPTDVSVGTAVLVDLDVTLASGGAFGPSLSTGYFGPRGVFQFEGLLRYGQNLSAFALAPVGYGDFVTVANTAGVARSLNYAWPFLVGRSILADGATVTLIATDVNDGGAAFVDSSVYATVDSGTIDGTTNDYEHVSYLSMPGIGGNSAIERRIAFDVMATYEGMHPLIPEPTGAHWSGAGNWDPTTPTLNEEIGLRVQPFALAPTKIGVQVWPGTMSNSTSTVVPVGVAVTPTLTVNDSAGFRTGSNFIGVQVAPTVIYDSDGGALASYAGMQSAPILKNASTEAHSIPVVQGIAQRVNYRGDGALLTVALHRGFDDDITGDIVSGGTVSVTAANQFNATATPGSGTTIVTRRGFLFNDGSGAGSITTQLGVDIPVLAKGTTNIGIRNASTEVATPSVATITAAGDTIAPNAKVKRLNNTSGGSVTLTSTPTIADGQDGQVLMLFNSSANNVVLTHGASNNLRLDGGTNKTLAQRASIELMFSSDLGDWFQTRPVVSPT